jgi:hypothetical protein
MSYECSECGSPQLAEPFSFNPRDLCQIPSATRRMSFPHVFLLEAFLGCPCISPKPLVVAVLDLNLNGMLSYPVTKVMWSTGAASGAIGMAGSGGGCHFGSMV